MCNRSAKSADSACERKNSVGRICVGSISLSSIDAEPGSYLYAGFQREITKESDDIDVPTEPIKHIIHSSTDGSYSRHTEGRVSHA